MQKVFLLVFCPLISGLTSAEIQNAIVDQSQLTYGFTADLHSAGISGQTFTAGLDGGLVGIRLLAEGAGFVAPLPYGSDFRINLRMVSPQNRFRGQPFPKTKEN